MDRTVARIEKDLLRRVSQILSEVKDLRIAAGLVSISKTQISRDLRVLKCYVTVNHGPLEQQAVLDALRKAHAFVRGRLGENLTLRYTPEIRFFLDDTPEIASRIGKILDGLPRTEVADQADPGAAPDPRERERRRTPEE